MSSIFLDLEIDISIMHSDPDEFAAQVYSKADYLLNILNSKTSLKGARQEAVKSAERNQAAKVKGKEWFSARTSGITDDMDSLSLDELFHAIQEAKELVKDLELEFYSRANEALVRNQSSVIDKGLAHEQYKQLRKSFDTFREFTKMIHKKNFVPLDPKSGNYGDPTMAFPSYKVGDEIYYNYRAVARLLDLNPDDFKNHGDLIEVLEAGDFNVEIIEVTL